MPDDTDKRRFRVIPGGTNVGDDDGDDNRDAEPPVARASLDTEILEARKALSAVLFQRAKDKGWSNNDAAFEHLHEALEHDPENAAAHNLHSQLLDAWDPAALAAATRALQLDPTNARYYIDRAAIFTEIAGIADHDDPIPAECDRRDFALLERAIADLNRALQTSDDVADVYFRRSRALTALGRLTEAYDDLTRALADESMRGAAIRNRLHVVRWMGDVDALRTEIDRALRMDPDHDAAIWHRAVVALEDRDYAVAIANASKLIDQRKQRSWEGPYPYYLRGVIHLRRGAPLDAIDDLTAAIGCDKYNGYFRACRAQARECLSDLDGAIADWEGSLDYDSRTAEFRIGLARALAQRGDRRRAIAQVKKAIEQDPRASSHHGDLARLYASAGRNTAARREIARARDLAKRFRGAAQPLDHRHHTLAFLESLGLDICHVPRIGTAELRAIERALPRVAARRASRARVETQARRAR